MAFSMGTRALLLFALPGALAWSCNDEGATEILEKVGLASVDPMAVCNDGTEAQYYIKDNGHESLWLIYLAGGGWCHDAESCAARFDGTEYPHHDCSNSSEAKPCFGSSKDYPKTCGKTGVFDTDSQKTPLHAANKVYVPYCSSDGHMGDGKFGSWQFRGARIARAVVNGLARSGKLRAGSTLVFGGGSAGGRGAMVLLDEIAKSLPKVKVLGFLDSPYYMDIPSHTSQFAGFQVQHVNVLKNFNASSIVSRDCAAAHKNEEWKCLFGQYRMPLITTPYLITAAQYDGWQLSHLVHDYAGIEKNPNYTKDELNYVEEFGAKTSALVRTLPSAMTPWAIVYSTACYNHHISEHTAFWSTKTSTGISESNAMEQLLRGGQRKGSALVDTCSTYNCGSGCSASGSITMV